MYTCGFRLDAFLFYGSFTIAPMISCTCIVSIRVLVTAVEDRYRLLSTSTQPKSATKSSKNDVQ